SRLTPGVKSARDLRAAKGSVVEQTAILPRERNALRHALIDDVHTDLCEAIHVGLARAKVAPLDRVVEQTPDAVAVVLVILRRVDAPLRGDAVRAPWGVLEAKRLYVVAELTQRRRGGAPRESRSHHDDRIATLVRGIHQLDLEAVAIPLALYR